MKKFKRIYIEITNVCNLKCSFCPKTSRKPEFISRDLLLHVLEEVKPFTDYLYFHVMGEPLLHPGIGSFLELCAEQDFHANITTNGTLIKENAGKLIDKKALRLINFSLHSLENSQTNRYAYLQDIFEFAELSRQSNPKLIICFRLWNYSHSSSILNQEIIRKIKNFFDYPCEIKKIPQLGNGLKLRENLYLSQSERFEWPDMKTEEIGTRGFCLALRDQIAILVDGTVVPCCLDREGSIGLGNIKESAFSEIIASPRAKNIYNGFSERRVAEELCRKCGYRTRF